MYVCVYFHKLLLLCFYPPPPPRTLLCSPEARRPHLDVFCVDCFWPTFSFLPLIIDKCRHRFTRLPHITLFIFDLIRRLELYSQSECKRQKKSINLSPKRLYSIIIRIFYTFFIPFTLSNNFSNYFKCYIQKPFVKALFVRPTCQDIESSFFKYWQYSSSQDCRLFFSSFKMSKKGLD